MIFAAVTPGPIAGDVQHGELLAGGELGQRLAVIGAGAAQGGGGREAAGQGTGVMGGDQLAGQRDIGDVLAIGMDARIERQRRPGEAEALSCAGG